MPDAWTIQPAALKRLRLDKLLNQEELAKKSGVSVRSIRAYERDAQPVRLETLVCLSKCLGCEVKELGRVAAKEDQAPARPPEPASPSTLPPRTPLETLVDLERAQGAQPPPVSTARGPVEVLTARRLHDVFTAFALHEGARFFLRGVVDTQRGIGPAEARLLGSRMGLAARFHILKEIAPKHELGVTVHSATEEHTQALQALQGKGAELVVRVVVVPGEHSDDGPGFTSFITRVASKRPWTFLVEEVTTLARARRGR